MIILVLYAQLLTCSKNCNSSAYRPGDFTAQEPTMLELCLCSGMQHVSHSQLQARLAAPPCTAARHRLCPRWSLGDDHIHGDTGMMMLRGGSAAGGTAGIPMAPAAPPCLTPVAPGRSQLRGTRPLDMPRAAGANAAGTE